MASQIAQFLCQQGPDKSALIVTPFRHRFPNGSLARFHDRRFAPRQAFNFL
jgi:hypothetical protein